jgi:hypothetical protein
MFNTIVGAGAVGAGAASRYGSGFGSDQKMRLLPAPQHCFSELRHPYTLTETICPHFVVAMVAIGIPSAGSLPDYMQPLELLHFYPQIHIFFTSFHLFSYFYFI